MGILLLGALTILGFIAVIGAFLWLAEVHTSVFLVLFTLVVFVLISYAVGITVNDIIQ